MYLLLKLNLPKGQLPGADAEDDRKNDKAMDKKAN